MNKNLILLFVLWGVSGILMAQNKAPMKSHELAPDWVHIQLPQRTNSSYFYQVFTIEDAQNRSEAEDKAELLAYQAAAKNQGIYIDDSTLKVSEMEKRIFLRLQCSYKEEIDGKNIYHFLYQISESGRTKPHYDDCDCNSSALGSERVNNEIKRSNAAAIALSAFIPGSGQMYKGHYTEGVFTMIGDLGLIGGGVAFHFMANKQHEVATAWNVDYETYAVANKQEKNLRIAEYSFFGAAGALYIFNLCRAYLAPNKKLLPQLNADLYPTIIPIDGISTPAVAIQINF